MTRGKSFSQNTSICQSHCHCVTLLVRM